MFVFEKQGKLGYIKYLIVDIACIMISIVLAYYMRHDSFPQIFKSGIGVYTQVLFVMILGHACISYLLDIYYDIHKRGYFKEFVAVAKQNIFIMLSSLLFVFFTQQGHEYSRTVYAYFFVINFILMYTLRIICKRIFGKVSKSIENTQNLYLITNSEYMFDVIDKIRKLDYEPKGLIVVDKDMTGKIFGGVPVVTDVNNVFEFSRLSVVDAIFIHLPKEDEKVAVLAETFTDMGITVHISVQNMNYDIPNMTLHDMGEFTVVSSSMRVATPAQMIAKRVIDISGALIGLLLTAVAMVIIGPIIYIQSPGPIFFKQTRIGRNGRKFKIYKFRSMYMDAEERKKDLMKFNKMDGLMFKMDDDPRITKIGKFIRKTSIDELPQFLNVLRGEMSLVGTRPPTLDEYEQYKLHHKKRLSMKPGLTGVWQVSGRSNVVDFEKVVQMDADYISNWSIALDCRLILKTVGVLFGDRDAC